MKNKTVTPNPLCHISASHLHISWTKPRSHVHGSTISTEGLTTKIYPQHSRRTASTIWGRTEPSKLSEFNNNMEGSAKTNSKPQTSTARSFHKAFIWINNLIESPWKLQIVHYFSFSHTTSIPIPSKAYIFCHWCPVSLPPPPASLLCAPVEYVIHVSLSLSFSPSFFFFFHTVVLEEGWLEGILNNLLVERSRIPADGCGAGMMCAWRA